MSAARSCSALTLAEFTSSIVTILSSFVVVIHPALAIEMDFGISGALEQQECVDRHALTVMR